MLLKLVIIIQSVSIRNGLERANECGEKRTLILGGLATLMRGIRFEFDYLKM